MIIEIKINNAGKEIMEYTSSKSKDLYFKLPEEIAYPFFYQITKLIRIDYQSSITYEYPQKKGGMSYSIRGFTFWINK